MVDDTVKKLYALSTGAFTLEAQGKYSDALSTHEKAAEVLQLATDAFKKTSKVSKFHRKMFERQVAIHRERFGHLKRLKAKGSYDGIVVAPTAISAANELEIGDSKPRPLSLDQKELYEYLSAKKSKAEVGDAPFAIRPLLSDAPPQFAPTLDPVAPPVAYHISHESELVNLGLRSHWMLVHDDSKQHLLFALQALWSNEAPIIQTVLRRAGEFLPGDGAIGIDLIKTRGKAFRLEMSTRTAEKYAVETPDRAQTKQNWSPRRFTYGGRQFVWKGPGDFDSGETKAPLKFSWETLFETTRVWAKTGSKTGKMEDDTTGPRLCWGESHGRVRTDHTIYMAAGLDQRFREHLLASQLTRYVRCTYPPSKDTQGVEGSAAVAGAGLLALVADIAGG